MRRTTNRTSQIIVLAGITYLAYILYKNGQNSESYYEEEVEEKSIEQLEKEMKIAVEKEEYEKAAILRDKIFSIKQL